MSKATATSAAKMRSIAYSCLLLVLAVVPDTATADNFAGDYQPLPTGTRILMARYAYTSGGELHSGGDLVDEDFDARDQQGQLKYSIGLSGWLFVPLGDYSPNNVINQGMNVWSARAEGNVTVRPSAAWTLELTMGVRTFTYNDDFGPASATLERSPRFLIETHVVRIVQPGLRLSVDYFWHGGNETTVNGVDRDDRWNDHAAQLTALWKLKGGRMLTGWYRNDFVVRSGSESQSVGLRLMQGF
jgi:hypothetical protein